MIRLTIQYLIKTVTRSKEKKNELFFHDNFKVICESGIKEVNNIPTLFTCTEMLLFRFYPEIRFFCIQFKFTYINFYHFQPVLEHFPRKLLTFSGSFHPVVLFLICETSGICTCNIIDLFKSSSFRVKSEACKLRFILSCDKHGTQCEVCKKTLVIFAHCRKWR